MLLRAATLAVTANLGQDNDLQTTRPGKIAEVIESTILLLFNFRHMTQLAVARNWRLASPEQQNVLIAEFKALLVRTYSTALANYRGQAIEYRPLRIAPGETGVTVKSTVKQPGTGESGAAPSSFFIRSDTKRFARWPLNASCDFLAASVLLCGALPACWRSRRSIS